MGLVPSLTRTALHYHPVLLPFPPDAHNHIPSRRPDEVAKGLGTAASAVLIHGGQIRILQLSVVV